VAVMPVMTDQPASLPGGECLLSRLMKWVIGCFPHYR
jgi:hypothetical protein